MEAATTALLGLRDLVDEAVLLAVWGTHGPTIVRWVEGSRPVTVNVRVGSTMPLLSSATGQVFGAFAPAALVEPVLARELVAGRGGAGGAPEPGGANPSFPGGRGRRLSHGAGPLAPRAQPPGPPPVAPNP